MTIPQSIQNATETQVLQFEVGAQLQDENIEAIIALLPHLKELHLPDLSLLSAQSTEALILALNTANKLEKLVINTAINMDAVLAALKNNTVLLTLEVGPEVKDSADKINTFIWRNESLQVYNQGFKRLMTQFERIINTTDITAITRLQRVLVTVCKNVTNNTTDEESASKTYFPFPVGNHLYKQAQSAIAALEVKVKGIESQDNGTSRPVSNNGVPQENLQMPSHSTSQQNIFKAGLN